MVSVVEQNILFSNPLKTYILNKKDEYYYFWFYVTYFYYNLFYNNKNMICLSSDYFQEILLMNEYRAYAPIDSPLILFSEMDGTALASVHFRPSTRSEQHTKIDMDTKTLILPLNIMNNNKSNHEGYLGLINKDHQEIEFVFSNLSDIRIAFWMKKHMPLSEEDMYELEPFQSQIVHYKQKTQFTALRMHNDPNDILFELCPSFWNSETNSWNNDKEAKCDVALCKYFSDKPMILEKSETKLYNKFVSNAANMIEFCILPEKCDDVLLYRFEKTKWGLSDFVIVKQPKVPTSESNEYNSNKRAKHNDSNSINIKKDQSLQYLDKIQRIRLEMYRPISSSVCCDLWLDVETELEFKHDYSNLSQNSDYVFKILASINNIIHGNIRENDKYIIVDKISRDD